jgi:streptogramin lyase
MRLSLEPLEDRCLPSVTNFLIPTPATEPMGIARGPDGNLWFSELHAIGRITPGGQVTEFRQGLSPGSEPVEITGGPDGNLWFTEGGTDRIGRITPAGVITEFSIPDTGGRQVFVFGISAGPDGNLWFTEQGGAIGRITPTGVVAVFPLNLGISKPNLITAGADGNLWWADEGGFIGRITPAGVITRFSAGLADPSPNTMDQMFGITAGPDGNLWFTESAAGRIGRISPAGVITEFSAGITANSVPAEITAGPDGNLWFTEDGGDRIGRITPAGVVTEFTVDSAVGSGPNGIAIGPDGNIWFTELNGNQIGRLDLPPAVTTTTLGTSAPVLGQSLTLTASVSSPSGMPTGIVTFKDGDAVLGLVPIDGAGQATLTASLGVGNHALTASYAATGPFAGSISPVVTETVGTADERYIDSLYVTLFHRHADPGAARWVNLLNQGVSPATIVLAIEASTEFRINLVQDLYQHYLHRQADDGGLQTFVNALAAGVTIEEVQAALIGSQEYFQLHSGTTDGFLTAAYQDALNRAPDAGGRAFWSQRLGAGQSRGDVAAEILGLQEFQANLVLSDYRLLLGRGADPTGAAAFESALRSGTTDQALVAAILGSPEAVAQRT